MSKIREILLQMFQKAKVDYDNKQDKFTGVFTLPDKVLDQAEAEIEKEFQRRLTERVNSERIEKIIYNWIMQNFDFKTLNSMNEHDKRRNLSEFIVKEIGREK